MITDVTRRAICALLAADDNATDSERERVAFAMRTGGRDVVTIGEVCQRIGRSRPTVWRLVKKGLLKAVQGSGTIATGISVDSLERYVAGRARA